MNLEYHKQSIIPTDSSFNSNDQSENSQSLNFFDCFEPAPGQDMGRSQFKDRVYGLFRQLDSDLFRERENAHAELMGMDRNVLPMMEMELRNSRSAEVSARLRTIHQTISGSERIQFQGNTGRDGVGRLREIRGDMTVEYNSRPYANQDNQIDSIHYPRAGGWSVIRQQDGTHDIYQDGHKGAVESGVRISVNHTNGNVRAVLRDGSIMIIPSAGPRWWYREGGKAPLVPEND
jgi:hypothetical protein